MTDGGRHRHPAADVVVVGGGLIGLACAAELAARGLGVILLADPRPGEASPAAAGMLAPSVERSDGSAHRFALTARDRYPDYVAWLAERTGIIVPLNRLGILELALGDEAAEALRAQALHGANGGAPRWLDRRTLAAEEPALAHAAGALLQPGDGAVDNVTLIRALEALVAADERIQVVRQSAQRIAFPGNGGGGGAAGVEVATARGGERLRAARLVLAAGAWAGQIEGLPRALPVEPLRGQMIALAAAPLRHVVYGAGGYAVPRDDGRTLIGATMERVAFDATTTRPAIDQMRATGTAICPALAGARLISGWAGLRPVTPDMLPIIGPDPEQPSLIYACGHSRNGILMAPLTADVVADLVTGAAPAHDLAPFRVERFSTSPR